MRFATVRDFRVSVSSVISKASGDETIVVTMRGRPVAVFVPVSEAGLENMMRAIERARLRDSVDELRRKSVKTGKNRMKSQEIEREIRAARRARHA